MAQMTTVAEALSLALQHHQAGRLHEAEPLYRQILAARPDHAEAWHLLGVIAHQVGRHETAVEYLSRAIALQDTNENYHNNLGMAYRALGRTAEAAASFEEALRLRPELAEAHYNQGLLWQDQANYAQAGDCFRRALQLRSDYPEAHHNLGMVYFKQGKWEDAAASFKASLRLNPNCAESHFQLGNVFKERGDLNDAVACYRKALQFKPDHAAAYNNLGVAWYSQGESNPARDCFQRAIQHQPNLADAHNNLGVIWQERGKLVEAGACYQRAIDANPLHAWAYNNLGNVKQDLGKWDEAVACCRRVLELEPDCLSAYGTLLHALQQMCQWDELDALSQRAVEAVDNAGEKGRVGPMSPFSFLCLPTTTSSRQQLTCAKQWVNQHFQAPSVPRVRWGLARPGTAGGKPKLTIGYLSADFRAHPVAYLIAELFEKHDRDLFDIFGYSYGPDDGSPIRHRLTRAFDKFVNLQPASHVQAAQRIAADDVDILVDLTGYTATNRSQILAFRPAPIQVNYLGYPGTMGASFMDYILVDDFILPPEERPFFTEHAVYLPGCYQVNDSQREIASTTRSRGECGLPEEGFVFCNFNNCYKISPAMFDVWMELLRTVSGSVLWLLTGNPIAPDNLRKEAKARGVAGERLVFAPYLPLPAHLARYRLADLFLDSFPYNAHTTASDALWVGCPVLTLAGQTFASRVAGSLLRTIGLPELITTNVDEYRSLALRLGQDSALRAGLRARLQAKRATSPLFDAELSARNLEAAYRGMWDRYISGNGPSSFRVSPPPGEVQDP